ncbi:MAG: endonuclease dU [Candidatus Bathyarchaeota archaeon]
MEGLKLGYIKKEIRIVGIDDGCVNSIKNFGEGFLVGVVYRGGSWIDGVFKLKVKEGCLDLTSKLTKIIKSSVHYGQIRLLMLNKLTFLGLNPLNPCKLSKKVKKPIMVVTSKPLKAEFFKDLGSSELEEFKKPLKVKVLNCLIFYVYLHGLDLKEAERVLEVTVFNKLPEPLRVARLIAKALNSSLTQNI